MLIGAAAFAAIGGRAAAEPWRVGEIWTDVWGRALKGYDCVSYFTSATPKVGLSSYELQWGGANWLFADMAAMKKFAHEPRRFAPLFGGYCAQTLASKGELVGCDPLVWDMFGDRLAMMSSADMREVWRSDPKSAVTAAKEAWRARFS